LRLLLVCVRETGAGLGRKLRREFMASLLVMKQLTHAGHDLVSPSFRSQLFAAFDPNLLGDAEESASFSRDKLSAASS
jgi:hypothetical protein